MRESLRLGKIAGVQVGVNWSVLIIAWLLTYGLATQVLPGQAAGYGSGAYWLAGLVAAAVFFGSLLAHELAHSIVARRNGIGVDGITLFLFGGVSKLSGKSRTPGADFRIAAVGPGVSVALAVGFGVLAAVLDRVGAATLVVAVVGWLALINLALGVFNLLPGAPLDGGRILRAALWRIRGDERRATVSAARAGVVVGAGLAALGVLELLFGRGLDALWLVLIGTFMIVAARSEEQSTAVTDVLDGVRVAEVMNPQPVPVPAWITVQALLDNYVWRYRHSAFPVLDWEGRPVGLVTPAAIRVVPPHERATTRLDRVLIPLREVALTTPDEPVTGLVGRLRGGRSEGRALVLDAGRLVGIVTAADVSRFLRWRSMQQPDHPAGQPLRWP